MDNTLSVTELNTEIKVALGKAYGKLVTVVGEITNFKLAGTTAFFSLKDAESKIDGLMFGNIPNNIPNGKQVKVTGTILLTVKSGNYRISAKSMELMGVGKLQQEYEKLKEKYESLGYFKDERKRALKQINNNIGVITSKDGAALQDFIYALNKNNFLGTVHVKHSLVQGKDCVNSVVNSLLELDEMNLDVIVMTRGGGSFEDLFPFSDGKILETLFNMKTVTVSAIGHQIDNMLCDFVADVRAPTPSLAGEAISCKKEAVFNLDEVLDMEMVIKERICNKLTTYEGELRIIKTSVEPVDKIMDSILGDLDKLISFTGHRIQNNLLKWTTELGNINVKPCDKITIVDMDNNVIDNVDKFKGVKKLTIKFPKGYVTFNVTCLKIYP